MRSGADEGNSLGYTGREDDGTGLLYYRARYYDPSLKRFVSVDPIGLAGGINVYAYVGNDPVSLTDAFGLSPRRGNNRGSRSSGCEQAYNALEKLGWTLVALDVLNSFVSPGPDVGIVGVGVIAAVKQLAKRGVRKLPFKDRDRLSEINKTLDRIERQGPFPHRKDGSTFNNKEGKLPTGNYREYTVNTPGASNRGTRRIVQDAGSGRTYYTDDHYRNLTQIDPRRY